MNQLKLINMNHKNYLLESLYIVIQNKNHVLSSTLVCDTSTLNGQLWIGPLLFDKHCFWNINVYWFFFFAGNRCLLTLIWVSRVLYGSSVAVYECVRLVSQLHRECIHCYNTSMDFEGFVSFLFFSNCNSCFTGQILGYWVKV